MRVRAAMPGERAALLSLQWRASLSNSEYRAALLANPDAIELPPQGSEAHSLFAAELDGALAGFAALVVHDDGEVELGGLFVEPELFRRGVGRALVEHCVGLARQEGAARLDVVANERAFPFYEACGFRFVEPVRTRFGPAVKLSRAL